MQTQDVPGEFMFRLWPWLEANKNRLIGVVVAAVVVSGVAFFISSHKEQREIDAGQALTALLINPASNAGGGSQLASGLEKLAADYAGTAAGGRAQLQAAATLFDAGNYAEAQAQFQKYLDANSAGAFAATAQLGLAASLEAQNKTDLAASAYQRVISAYPGSTSVAQAEFALGHLAEQQKKLSEAMSHFEKATSAARGGSLAQEAMMRAMDLRNKLAAAAPKPAVKPQFEAAPKTSIPPQNPVKP